MLYDTTLRDGAQTEGISFSVDDKLRVTARIDQLGVHVIEGGWPGASPKELEFFQRVRKLKLRHAVMAAFGSTRRPGIAASDDANLNALIQAKTPIVTIFGKTWDLHVREALRVSLDENLKMIANSVAYLRRKGREVVYDAEHFFDGYRSNPEYALKTLEAAAESGCSTIALCDTNGGTLTSELARVIAEVRRSVRLPLGIHVHNDAGLAVANSLAAMEAGCVQVQGTINGYGERCGNADLVTIIPNLKLKMGVSCVSDRQLADLAQLSRFVADVANMRVSETHPYVGSSAFAHKGGIHINAVMKNPKTYEHVSPERVGNERRLLLSELSGKSSIMHRASKMRLHLTKETPETKALHQQLQQLEHQGYHFEAAEASFELVIHRTLKQHRRFFDLEGFRVTIEKRNDKLVSEATIKVKVDGVSEHTAAEGDGPVNALDNALRKALEPFYPSIRQVHLSDFKVRVLNERAGTAARVRVLIECRDAVDAWTTVGVSENVIEASWQALVDSVEYKLLKDQRRRGRRSRA